MPDFERLTDDFRVYNAKTHGQRMYELGVTHGKNKARREMVKVALFIAICYTIAQIILAI